MCLSEGSAAGRVGTGGGFTGDVTARGSGPDPVAGSPGIIEPVPPLYGDEVFQGKHTGLNRGHAV